MTAKISGSRKLKRNSLPKFNHSIYSRISSRNLLVFAVHYLLEQEIEVRLEDIVFACFLLFPQKFALKKYPRWPDSAAVGRRLSDCRSRRYIAVNTDLGIKLTVKGSRLAERVAKVLGVSKAKRTVKALPSHPKKRVVAQEKEGKPVSNKKKVAAPEKIVQVTRPKPKMHVATTIKKTKIIKKTILISPAPLKKTQSSPPDVQAVPVKPARKAKAILSALSAVPKEVKIRAGKFVHLMERSDAYIHYKKNGKNSKIGEFDFRSLLLCTMESSRETLVRNVSLFKNYASIHNRQDLLIFLSHCEDRFSYLLVPPQKPLKKRSREKEFHG